MKQSGYDHGAVGRYLADGTVREPAARTTARELYTAYTEWMRANGLARWIVTERAFGQAVKDHGIQHKRTNTAIYYLGITPRP